MTELDVNSEEATGACKTALRWLNMQVNQIKPYTLKSLNKATKLENGHYNLLVTLVTQCFEGRDFNFDLELDPAVKNPTALLKHKQLE
ncbi:hypothetical protein M9Y10_038625 [Tritrichomonas musculus]|uniref:Calponin-homology (CH) domain-containing protein n=1 Tax=Tritrichomonas musculus TaxID=1915356 RepID=A0ABR2K8Z3_9EUKA